MTEAEMAEVLSEARSLQVATNGRDGFPHLTTLWFCVVEGKVTFRSFTKSQRIVNLRRDRRFTVLAELGEDYDELRGVMIQGTAELSTDPAAVMETYRRVTAKMQRVDDVAPEVVEALFGRFADKNTVVTMIPERVISWDHRKLDTGY
jgi:general stress protein 26